MDLEDKLKKYLQKKIPDIIFRDNKNLINKKSENKIAKLCNLITNLF